MNEYRYLVLIGNLLHRILKVKERTKLLYFNNYYIKSIVFNLEYLNKYQLNISVDRIELKSFKFETEKDIDKILFFLEKQSDNIDYFREIYNDCRRIELEFELLEGVD